MSQIPLLPTSTIGSYAPPSWFVAAVEAIERGEFGPTDREETYIEHLDRRQVRRALKNDFVPRVQQRPRSQV